MKFNSIVMVSLLTTAFFSTNIHASARDAFRDDSSMSSSSAGSGVAKHCEQKASRLSIIAPSFNEVKGAVKVMARSRISYRPLRQTAIEIIDAAEDKDSLMGAVKKTMGINCSRKTKRYPSLYFVEKPEEEVVGLSDRPSLIVDSVPSFEEVKEATKIFSFSYLWAARKMIVETIEKAHDHRTLENVMREVGFLPHMTASPVFQEVKEAIKKLSLFYKKEEKDLQSIWNNIDIAQDSDSLKTIARLSGFNLVVKGFTSSKDRSGFSSVFMSASTPDSDISFEEAKTSVKVLVKYCLQNKAFEDYGNLLADSAGDWDSLKAAMRNVGLMTS
tara:strand:+ start:7642 stop:8631 length:990 start_codon:yes stop_codon:yes gene_type:complete